jgi:hypothetical protein
MSDTAESIDTSEGDWRSSLDPDLRDLPALKDYPDINALVKSHVSSQQMLGSSIRIPSEDASDEARKAFYERLVKDPRVVVLPEEGDDLTPILRRLGTPEKPEGYEGWKPPEGFQIDSEAQKTFYEQAHRAGLTKQQAHAMQDFWSKAQVQRTQSVETTMKKGVEQLRMEWGQAFDDKVKAAQRVVKSLGPEFGKFLANTRLGNHPVLIKAFSEVASRGLEPMDSAVDRAAVGRLTPAEAMATVEDIRGNPAHPYNNPDNPSHAAAVKKVRELYKLAFPE